MKHIHVHMVCACGMVVLICNVVWPLALEYPSEAPPLFYSQELILRVHFYGKLELEVRVQHAPLENQNCRDWRDWRPSWRSFSCQSIECKHENKVCSFTFCLSPCPRFPSVPTFDGNAFLVSNVHILLYDLLFFGTYLVPLSCSIIGLLIPKKV
jgi:hypothetical protein